MTLANFVIDEEKEIIRLATGEVVQPLAPRDIKLLCYLSSRTNEILSVHETLIEAWGEDGFYMRRVLEVHITRLHKIFRQNPKYLMRFILNEGYIYLLVQPIPADMPPSYPIIHPITQSYTYK
jgi:DNA-binding response OmpR family regulator